MKKPAVARGGLFGGGGGGAAAVAKKGIAGGAVTKIFGFSEGGVLPMDRPSLVHRGEVLVPTPRMPTMALPESLVQGVLSAAGGAGGGDQHTYHIQVNAAGGVNEAELAQQIVWQARINSATARPAKRR